MVALDGLTKAYERYRKGGKIEWVFANVRAIADAKKRLGATTPYLRWQWLTFAHNIHEVPAAIDFAREIGFDSFNLATPNRVSTRMIRQSKRCITLDPTNTVPLSSISGYLATFIAISNHTAKLLRHDSQRK